uniref:RGS domain-containing protein n=1 Tax=Steinernema glaseri TaxID=37863 RepID=A0A1I7ZE66_9BILA
MQSFAMNFEDVWAALAVEETIYERVFAVRRPRSLFNTIFETYRKISEIYRGNVASQKPLQDSQSIEENGTLAKAQQLYENVVNARDFQSRQVMFDEFRAWIHRQLHYIEVTSSA